MTTRFLLPGTAASVPITPTADAAWEDTSILARLLMSTTTISDAMATVSFSDSDNTNKDILFRQMISAALTAGQTITGSQALKFQARCQETGTGKNMFLTAGLRVLAGDGSTVRKTVLAVTRDNLEASSIAITNRQFTATSAATDYTTVADDRLVLEIGMAGTPTSPFNHTSNIRLGDAAASDLSEDDTSTTDNRPWFELSDTRTFGAAATKAPPVFKRRTRFFQQSR